MLQETGVDGVTVARGCIGNPFIFDQVRDLLAGRDPREPDLTEWRGALEHHAREALAFYGDKRAVSKIRSHAIRYAAHHPEPITARDAFVAMRDLDGFERALESLTNGATTPGVAP